MVRRSKQLRLVGWAAAFGLLAWLAAPARTADPAPLPETPPKVDPGEVPRTEFSPATEAARIFKEMYPSPTDDLMAPSPPVPPRKAYQRPETPPVRPSAPPPEIGLPAGTPIAVPAGVSKNISYIPRYGVPFQKTTEKQPDGSQRLVMTGGIIVNVTDTKTGMVVEFASDNVIAWIKGLTFDLGNSFDSKETQPGKPKKIEIEFYMAGNVVVRTMSRTPVPIVGKRDFVTQTLRADQVYYDVEHNRAISLAADLELSAPALPDSIHMQGREIWRLGVDDWEIKEADLFSSKMPADPGMKISTRNLTLSQRKILRRNIFGIPYRDIMTGQTIEGSEQLLTARNSTVEVFDVPIFYLPYLRTDAADPLGPFVGLGFGQDRIFGTQLYTTWDMYKLLALRGPPNHKWILNADYLSDRGPAVGTNYYYQLLGTDPDGIIDPRYPSRGSGQIKLYGINDKGLDVLGGDRGTQPVQPDNRGRAMWRHTEAFGTDWFFQGQIAAVSDVNFLEQYYKNEWDMGPNQETFAYLTWQRGNLGASALIEPKLSRPWIDQTMSLPRVNGNLIGQSFFDLFVYNAQGEAGYFLSRPAQNNPYPVLPTDQRIDTGRFDLNQELSLPFELGALKLAPYAKVDLTQYTEDLTGDAQGRVIGGGGLRASLPFSRLYEDANSDLFNIRQLYHKAVLSGNYYNAHSNTPYAQLPLLDRLNDDAVDQAYRNMRIFQSTYYPGPVGSGLQFGQQFDPQRMAIRRLVDNRIDTKDSIDVLQLDLRQRLQTKRGYIGQEHVVDVAMLNLSASYFPEPQRDNFDHPWSFLEYDFLWNLGDRTSLVSSGWFEPYNTGSRYYNLGAYFDRPDRTNIYIGYRQTDPLNSKAVTAAFGYQMSRKYFTNLAVTYDFGLQSALSNTLTLTRTGTDLTFTFGITYNALVNNFGVQFMVLPNLVATSLQNKFGLSGLGTGR